MNDERSDEIQGTMELSHEPVPGYRSIFFIAITAGSVYLAIILLSTIF